MMSCHPERSEGSLTHIVYVFFALLNGAVK